MTISEAFELYRLEHIVYLNQSKKTEEMSLGAMNALIKFTGDIPVTDLTFDLVRKWKEHLEKDKGQNTVRGYIIKLRVVLKHLIIRGQHGVLNPDMVGVPARKSTVVDFITPEEVNRLIDASFELVVGYSKANKYRNRAIIALLYASGVRVSELCALNRTTLQTDDKAFTVIGKGDKARLCFYDDRAAYYIKTYLELRKDNHPALFLSDATKQRVTSATVQEVFKNVTRRAGFNKPIHPHTMRHSFATNLLKNNTNIVYVKDFLGHSSVQTTQVYMHTVDKDLEAIYREKHTI